MKEIHYSVNLIMTATVLNRKILVRKVFMIWDSQTERTGLRRFQFSPASRKSSVFTSQITFASSSGTLCSADSILSEGTSTHNSQHNMHIQPCNVLQKETTEINIQHMTQDFYIYQGKNFSYFIGRHFI